MLVVGQSVTVEYIGGPPPDDMHNDLKGWWVRDYNAVIVSLHKDHVVVKDLDASDDLFECTCIIWSGSKTVNINTQDK
jgi:hypothetical protein